MGRAKGCNDLAVPPQVLPCNFYKNTNSAGLLDDKLSAFFQELVLQRACFSVNLFLCLLLYIVQYIELSYIITGEHVRDFCAKETSVFSPQMLPVIRRWRAVGSGFNPRLPPTTPSQVKRLVLCSGEH